jgi:hypothetical protein
MTVKNIITIVTAAAAAILALLKVADHLTGGRLTEYTKNHWVPWLRSFLTVRYREVRLVRKQLRKQLQDDGYPQFALWRSETLELAESFCISLKLQPDRRIASSLPRIFAEGIGRDQKLFSIASESGGGKTVLGLLLPLLCYHYPKDDLAALYVGPADWVKGAPISKVIDWLAGWPKAKRKLIIIDSFNEVAADNIALLQKLRSKIDEHYPSNCGFLVLYRPTTTKQGDIFAAIAAAFDERPFEINLHFEPSDAQQCTLFRRLFKNKALSTGQISNILRIYGKLFPGYRLTRLSSVFVLRHLYDSFRHPRELPVSEPPVRPPGDIVFDGILPLKVNLDDPDLGPLSEAMFDLVKRGHRTTRKDFNEISEKLRQYPITLKYDGSLISEIDGTSIKRSEMIFAALHIARMIADSKGVRLSPDLEQFRGRSTYDACSAFVLPAYRRLKGDSGVLYETLAKFLNLNDAPFSFCAQIIHSNYDFLLISREASEDLSHKLFRRLIQAIDHDRRKTCKDSIRESPAGPNPLLDQLFEVVSAYGDSAVQLLVDNILLPSWADLEKSQGAYLILDWLKRLFACTDEEIGARRRHIYTILNGFEALSTENLHCRFHVVEVLDALTSYKDKHLSDLPGFPERLDQLLERYGRPSEPVSLGKDGREMPIYEACNRLVSAWAKGLHEGELLADLADKELQSLLDDFEKLVHGFYLDQPDSSISISTADLEQVLECYEVLLGISRRVCRQYARPRFLRFAESSANSPLWIVRWWAFYNMSQLILSLLSKPESASTIYGCLKWMVDQLYRSGEPMGLKHRQCTVLQLTLEREKIPRDVIQKYFRSHAALDEIQVTNDYTEILPDHFVASRSLDEYFQRMRRFEAEYR